MAKQNNSFGGHRPLEKSKYSELRKFINHWLSDQTIYCGTCGFPYFPGTEACCDEPRIGKNFDHTWAVIIQNKARQKLRDNQFAANKTKTMRLGLSMPPELLSALEKFSQEKFGEKLFVNQKDMHGFMKAFPQFMICERI